jgi:hypothetical protein
MAILRKSQGAGGDVVGGKILEKLDPKLDIGPTGRRGGLLQTAGNVLVEGSVRLQQKNSEPQVGTRGGNAGLDASKAIEADVFSSHLDPFSCGLPHIGGTGEDPVDRRNRDSSGFSKVWDRRAAHGVPEIFRINNIGC